MSETLILLPGLVSDRAVWQAQCDALAPRVRCLVPEWGLLDSLGAGAGLPRRHPPGRGRPAAAARGGGGGGAGGAGGGGPRGGGGGAPGGGPPPPSGRFALAGHSMGGRVAFEVWRRAPGRVERLALLDTSYHPRDPGAAGEDERAARLRLLGVARCDGMRALGRAWLPDMVHARRVGTPLYDDLLAMVERSSPGQYAAQVAALLARPDAWPLLATIDCPTLLLCGRDDAWSPPARHEHMHAAIAGSRLVVVDDCGHFAPVEQPAAVSRALAVWLDADPPPRI